jgi:hypothetical protein
MKDLFGKLEKHPEILLFKCNHGMTKTHTTRIVSFPSAEIMEEVLRTNREAETKLFMICLTLVH